MSPKTLVLSVAVLNLVAGLSFGFALGRSSAEPTLAGAPCEVARDAVHDPEFAHLADALALPPEQDARVRAILASCAPRMDAVLGEVKPRLAALHDQLTGELAAVLTKDQMSRLIEEFHRRYGPMAHAR